MYLFRCKPIFACSELTTNLCSEILGESRCFHIEVPRANFLQLSDIFGKCGNHFQVLALCLKHTEQGEKGQLYGRLTEDIVSC